VPTTRTDGSRRASPRTAAAPAPRPARPAAADPAPRRTLVGHVVDRLAAQIRAGALAPGDRLPTEPELCARFEVSRTVVREAVAQLKAEQLVDSVQGAGVYVTRRAPGEGVLRLRGSAGAGLADTAREMLEFRAGLETQAARLAARRRDDADLAAMRAALDRLDGAERAGATGSDDDLAFHMAIARASGNAFIVQTLEFLSASLRHAIEQGRGASARRGTSIEAAQREHRQVLDAIVAGDAPRAARAMAGHLAAGERRLLDGAPRSGDAASDSAGPAPAPRGDARARRTALSRPRSARPQEPTR
jgi:GntR family transcriptional repressor for pyruvate dehydrogenase complex